MSINKEYMRLLETPIPEMVIEYSYPSSGDRWGTITVLDFDGVDVSYEDDEGRQGRHRKYTIVAPYDKWLILFKCDVVKITDINCPSREPDWRI
jgi:hypothetical protein